MAASFIAQRRRQLRTTGQRLQDEHQALATAIGRLFLQVATARSEGGERIIPNRRSTRDALVATIYAQVLKPYYIGSGEEPFAGVRPLSPYAQLLYDGVRGMVRVEAEAQAALVRRLVSDTVVVDWLLQSYQPRRPVQEMNFESFTQWVDPRGFRLTERIQRVAVEVRSRVARFVDYHIGQGTPAPTMATTVEAFLTTGERGNTPYGTQGAVAAKVLAQHEMAKAGGDAVVAESEINPFVRGAQWLLDPAHPRADRCDDRANGGEEGDGIYPLSTLPPFPEHPRCMCHLRAVPVRNPAAVTTRLRQAIDERAPAAEALRGALNPERVTTEVLTSTIQQTADQMKQAPFAAPKAPPRRAPAPPVSRSPIRMYQADAAQQATVNASVKAVVERAAQRTKLSVDEVEQLLNKAMGELTQADIAVQIDSSRIDGLLDSGRFKTQFEVAPASSGATYDLDYRRRAEQKGLGVPTDAGPLERPVYGYMNLSSMARKRVSDYGDITVVLSDNVRNRTTVTIGDSLDGFDKNILAGSPINAPTRVSWDHQVSDLLDYARSGDLPEFLFSTGYVETQVQGGVGLNDVKAILDEKGKLTAAQKVKLEAQGIQVLQGDAAKISGKLAERNKPTPPPVVEKPPPAIVKPPVIEKPPAPTVIEKPPLVEKPKGGLLSRLGFGGTKSSPPTADTPLFPPKEGTKAADAFYQRIKSGGIRSASGDGGIDQRAVESEIEALNVQRQKASRELMNYGLKNPKATTINDQTLNRLNNEHNAVVAQIKEKRALLQTAQATRKQTIFEEIARERGYTKEVAVETASSLTGVHAEAVDIIKQMSPANIKFKYVLGDIDRAFFQGDTMYISHWDSLETPLHEFGHALENWGVDPRGQPYLDRSSAFYKERTKDWPLEHMGAAYGANEFTVPDSWMNKYTGIDYGQREGKMRATEIISMGIEHMLNDPVKFYEADKQHFAFIYEILMGR